MRSAACFAVVLCACAGQAPDDLTGDVDSGATDDGGAVDHDAGPNFDPAVHVPLDADRPVDLLPPDRLAHVASRMPKVADPWLKAILESADTMFYDDRAIVPGYQDSFGDNVVAPIGMRPNSIDRVMIDTAVPGGHAQVFAARGRFHFPFGRGIAGRADNLLVDFWHVPRDGGALLPVVWWRRDPNQYTHRYEWMFPVGTVLGEVLFVVHGGEWYPYEIRVRVRELNQWRADAYRPFPTADALATALDRLRGENPAWQSAADVTALLAAVRNPATLTAATLSATHFAGGFAAQPGAKDVLPAVADATLVGRLLMDTPFSSARSKVWKQSGALRAFAPTTAAAFHVVPRDYDGGFLEVSDASCTRCHENAGRPFRDYYDNILAYGELWGMDDAFTWHPFVTANFVDADGDVANFNYDNRRMRPEFVSGGVLTPYDPGRDRAPRYGKLPGAWKDFVY